MEHPNTIESSKPPTTVPGMDYAEELLAEVDEPPDEQKTQPRTWAPPKLAPYPSFNKADPKIFERRESLLTRQLHSEAEQTDDEVSAPPPPRTLSTHSTWSNPSTASTAELTSDDGHSVASPFHSPPLPPTVITSHVPAAGKTLAKEPKIVEPDTKLAETGSEQSVEVSLGRKRCISFACGANKNKQPPVPQPQPVAASAEPTAAASPPKRKCALKFVCPTRAAPETKPLVERQPSSRRLASPPPPERRSKTDSPKVHRGSDSTITHASPKSVRKISVLPEVPAASTTPVPTPKHTRKFSNDSDKSTEALRFHEFASSDDEPEEWVQESTCYKSRLTVNDTLQKEITIRKACQEVEEEALEEEEDEDEDDDVNGVDDDEDVEADEDDVEPEEESDDGFRTDDEEGFAESDDEGDDSDEDWWRPGGLSTAATSMDHMDQLAKNARSDDVIASSMGSQSSSHMSPRALLRKPRKAPPNALPILPRSETIDLPDSTDFVCGTLDEDRPLEQAFLNHKKEREAAKHKARPQDIDPTFPTSDPEMDGEDDDDLIDPEESDHESLMHGKLEDLDGENFMGRRPSRRGARPTHIHRSPPPPARHRSPAPAPMKRKSTARSPPPPVRRGTARSPAPMAHRRTAHSPAPHGLFANSPKRHRSPAPVMHNVTSPPNTTRVSPVAFGLGAIKSQANVLASRPQLTHTASLPRNGGYTLGKFNGYRIDDGEETETGIHVRAADHHKRGAIDIYKGLEKKRQRRKEKLHAKMCAKAAAKGEKAYRVKPGKGAERMREVGLELQRYRGKGEHILSM